jgi:thiol-disulfide isomerase/thioredoxin
LDPPNQDVKGSEQLDRFASLLTALSAPVGRSSRNSARSNERKRGTSRQDSEPEVFRGLGKPDLLLLSEALSKLAADCADDQVFSSCVMLLLRYIENIIKEPDNPKFRHIRKTNRAFTERINTYPAAMECLKAIGFQELPDQNVLEAPHLDIPQLNEAAAIIREALTARESMAPVQDLRGGESIEEETTSRVHYLRNAEEWYDLLLEAPGLVVVKFGATWCGPCHMVKPYFEELSMQPEFADVTFVSIDADDFVESTPGDASPSSVKAFPTFKFFRNCAEDELPVEGADIAAVEQVLRSAL